MFSRAMCYAFVRPKRSCLEVSLFLGCAVKAPQVRRADRKSKIKVANIVKIRHRDEVEAPFTDWLEEAYRLPDVLAARPPAKRPKTSKSKRVKTSQTRHTRTAARTAKAKARAKAKRR